MDSGPFVRTNVLGTQVLLDAARELGVRTLSCRFRPTRSTAAWARPALSPKRRRWRRTAPTPPARPPPTCWCAATSTPSACRRVITRCSNNYGPYQFPEKLIPLFISNLMRDEPVPVYGDGLKVRDWIHVRDHCAAHPPRLARRPAGRGLQPRRPLREDQPGPDARPARRARQAAVADPLRQGPPRPRSPLRHRLHQGRARTGLEAAGAVRAGAARDGALVSGATPTGSPASAAANT